MEKFGKKAKDKVTGFEGIITAKCLYMYGCAQYLLTPQVDVDGKLRQGEWFDEGRIETFEEAINPKEVKVEENGCEFRNTLVNKKKLMKDNNQITDAEHFRNLNNISNLRGMKKAFQYQLETNKPVSEEILAKLKIKKYYSGKNIEIGDIVLSAFLKTISSSGDGGTWTELILLNESEFELYSVDEKMIEAKWEYPIILNRHKNYMPTLSMENDKLIFSGEFHFEFSPTILTYDNCPLQKATFNWCPIIPNEIILKFGEYAVLEAYCEKLKEDLLKHFTKTLIAKLNIKT